MARALRVFPFFWELLLPFFFSSEYTDKQKQANFDYYEPRCTHESSLSPGIHAILAAELGRLDVALSTDTAQAAGAEAAVSPAEL